MRVSPEGDFDPVYVRKGHHGAMMMVVILMVLPFGRWHFTDVHNAIN